MKKCTKCSIEKSLIEYHNHSGNRDGKQGKCKQCIKEYNLTYKASNQEYVKEYYTTNKEKIVKQTIERDRKRREIDSLFKLDRVVRVLIRDAFKRSLNGVYKKGKKTEYILGCTMKEFIQHLQSQFVEGMTLENHGIVWEIDHIKKLSSSKNEEDIIKLNHYTNLRPLFKTTETALQYGYSDIIGNRNRKKFGDSN
jgi:hypothetical protein